MGLWEQILLGMAAVVILFLFWPGVRQALRRSEEVENPDWQGALIPLAIVILFVIFLVNFAK